MASVNSPFGRRGRGSKLQPQVAAVTKIA